jgi:phage-related protein
VHPRAAEELLRLTPGEAVAVKRAIDKLEAVGDLLRFPHHSKVHGANLRELRPRGGRSPWRALYRRVGAVLVVATIAPEARSTPRGSTERSGWLRSARRARAVSEEVTDEGL